MNATIITHETFAQTICEVNILASLSGPGMAQTYVCERDGEEILIIADGVSGDAIVIHPCSQDSEAGGSIHAHARASIA